MTPLLALLLATTPAEALVQRQVDAYNAGDIETFATSYAEDAVLYDHPGKLLMQGRAALRAQYGPMFARQACPQARVVKRMVVGDNVIDEEEATLGGKPVAHVVAIYHVNGGLIDRVDFLSGDGGSVKKDAK